MSVKIIANLDPFSSEKTFFEADSKTIREILRELGAGFSEDLARVCRNGEIVRDFSITAADGDELSIKFVSGGGSSAGNGMKAGGTLVTILGIVLGAAFSWTGFGAAVGIALIGTGIGLVATGGVLNNIDIPAYNLKNRETPKTDPSIRGGRNQARQYGRIPVLFGRRRLYPDLAALPYTEIIDGAQYYTQLFCGGYKDCDIDLSTLKLGETLLTNFSTEKNIDTILSGGDANVSLEILQGGQASALYPVCVHEEALNVVLKKETEDEVTGDIIPGAIIRTTPDKTETINVDIFFYNGLGKYNNKGDLASTLVEVSASYKSEKSPDIEYVSMGFFHYVEIPDVVDGGTLFEVHSNKIEGSELKTKRCQVTKSGLAPGTYTVKVERITEDSTDSKIIDTVYVGSIRSKKSARPVRAERQKDLTIIALRTRATEQMSGSLDAFNYVAASRLPVCDDSVSAGPAQWLNSGLTRNPAAMLMYALKGRASQQVVEDTDIDYESFRKFYAWCEEHSYFCDAYLAEAVTITGLFKMIGLTARAEVLRIDSKISVVQDIERDAHVQLFTPKNTISYTETMLMADTPDALSFQFIDEESKYAESEVIVYNTPSGNKSAEPKTTQKVDTWGITNSGQIRRIGMYNYGCIKNRPFVRTLEVDIEYLLCNKGDWIQYAGDIALTGSTQGRVAGIKTSGDICPGFYTDEPIVMESGKQYGVRIRLSDSSVILEDVTFCETPRNEITFNVPMALSGAPEAGDIYAFGLRGSEVVDLIITDIRPQSNLTATLTCVDYSPEIFGVDSPGFILPDFESKITPVTGETDSGKITDWRFYQIFHDGKTTPPLPAGNGQNGGWHQILTEASEWQSSKTAASLESGEWGAPIKLQKGDSVAPAPIPLIIPDLSNVDDEGIVTLFFSESTDEESGLARYNVYRKARDRDAQKIGEVQAGVPPVYRDETALPRESYIYLVSAVDKAGNETALSGGWAVDITVSAAPDPVSGLQAVAGNKDYIKISFFTPPAVRPVKKIAYFRFRISRDAGENWHILNPLVSFSAEYWYDRSSDGYPEQEDLEEYRFEITPVSIYDVEGESVVTNIDTAQYGTWIPSLPTNIKAVAEETGINIAFNHTNFSIFYGEAVFNPVIVCRDQTRPGAPTREKSYFYRFDRSLDGYPEKSTVTGDYYKISDYTVAITVTNIIALKTVTSPPFAVNESGYGTWIPPEPGNFRAEAEETGIRLRYGLYRIGLYGDILFIPHVYCNDEERDSGETREESYFYGFNRPIDGYPEKSTVEGDYNKLGNYSVQIEAFNRTTGYSSLSGVTAVNEQQYKTWIPQTPEPYFSASGRTIAIAWREQREIVYGTIAYDVQIAKQHQVDGSGEITDRSLDENWYAPAANDTLIYQFGNDYKALLEDNSPENNGFQYHYGDLPAAWHKTEPARRVNGTTLTAMVPLDQETVTTSRTDTETGETREALASTAKNTTYFFRMRAFNMDAGTASGYSGDEGFGDPVTSCATNAQDIVNNAINTAQIVNGAVTAEKLFVRSLAAITANMGVISNGALAGNAWNYWALSTILGQHGVEYHEGEFRVGGKDRYLKVTPVLQDGSIIDYEFELKAGDFSITSAFSTLNGELIVTYSGTALDRTRITPGGTYYEHRRTPQSDWYATSKMETAGVMALTHYSNRAMIVTNSGISDRRKNGSDLGLPYLSEDSDVYHFDTDFTNQYGDTNLTINHDGPDPILVDKENNNGFIDFTPAILAVAPYSEVGRSLYGAAKIETAFTANNYTVEFWLNYLWNENQILFTIGNINDAISLQLLNNEPYYNDEFDDVPYNNETLEPDQLVYNDIAEAHGELIHSWQGGSESIDLSTTHGIGFEENGWYHIAVTQDAEKLSCFINDVRLDFYRTSLYSAPVDVGINESKGSIIIDELIIDKNVDLLFEAFAANTTARIPYAALDNSEDYFILEAKDPKKVKTNLFSSEDFKQAVLAVINQEGAS